MRVCIRNLESIVIEHSNFERGYTRDVTRDELMVSEVGDLFEVENNSNCYRESIEETLRVIDNNSGWVLVELERKIANDKSYDDFTYRIEKIRIQILK